MIASTFYNGWSIKLKSIFASVLLVIAQIGPVVFLPTQASAAGQITFGSQFENEILPGSNTWATGQLDNYSEGDFINFRFDMEATDATSAGVMQIERDLGACNFFTDQFEVVSVTPAIATVIKGSQTLEGTGNGQYYNQNLIVTFNSSGSATVIFKIQLSNTAGDCTGSSTQARQAVDPITAGDFANVGAKTLPLSANQVLENPSLTITKTVTSGGASPHDFTFNISPAITGIINGNPITNATQINIPNGENSVTITEVNPDGSFTITESGPAGYTFTGGTGTSCTYIENSLGTANGKMVAVVTADADNPIDAVCNFTNDIQKGSIKIIKNTEGGDATFNFTSDFGINQLSTVSGTASQTVTDLAPGTYSISETIPEGWDLKSATCDDGSAVSEISLQPNENIVCTFTNVKRGKLVVQKTTYPTGHGQLFNVTASASEGSIIGDAKGVVSDLNDYTYTVTPGTYSVVESVPGGWFEVSNNCDDIVVGPGETKYCEIVNQKYAKLTIEKIADPKDGTDFPFTIDYDQKQLATFVLDNDPNSQTPDKINYSSLDDGDYTVVEDLSNLQGWYLDKIECGGATVSAVDGGVVVTINPNDDVTCKFYNVKFGSISGTKYETNSDGSNATGLMDWTIKLLDSDEQVVEETTTDENGDYLFDMLKPGDYTVIEVMQNGWTQIDNGTTCNDQYLISLSAGESSTDNDFCNFENGTIKGYKWNDINGDGLVSGEPKLAGWTIFIDENNNQQLDNGEKSTITDVNGNYSFTNLAPGTYIVCEVIQTGWVQTFPGTQTGCSSTTIDKSDEQSTKNFGNQGRGTVTVIKDVVNDNGGKKTYKDFTFDLAANQEATPDVTGNYSFNQYGQDLDDGKKVVNSVPAGSYSVTEPEANTMGYTTSYSNDCTNLVVTAGGNATCTITNDDIAPKLTLYKQVTNNNSGESDASDWTLYATPIEGQELSGNGHDGFVEKLVKAGVTYTLSEQGPEGYFVEYDWDCEGGTQVGSEITLKLAENVTCWIVNNDVAHPEIEIVKSGPDYAHEGDEIRFDAAITNTGDAPLKITSVLDDVAGVVEPIYEDGFVKGDVNENNILDVDETWYGYVLYTVPNEQEENIVNTMEVCAYDVSDMQFDDRTINELSVVDAISIIQEPRGDVCDDDTHTTDILHPAINVEKSGPVSATSGSAVTYTFTVTNVGDTELTVTSVEDNIAGEGTYQSGDTDGDKLLDLDETWIYTAEYKIPAGQVAPVENTVEVCGLDALELEVCDTDKHETTIPQVLAAVTPKLVEAESNALLSLMSGMFIISSVGVLLIANKFEK